MVTGVASTSARSISEELRDRWVTVRVSGEAGGCASTRQPKRVE